MNDTAGPIAQKPEGHNPAGWISPESHEAQQRQIHREQVLRELEQAHKEAIEGEVDRRLEAARGPQEKPADAQEAAGDTAVVVDGVKPVVRF